MSTPANFFATITATDGVADVIFVHGLSGDPVETWTFEGSSEAEGGYWPHWLASDLDGQIVAKLGQSGDLLNILATKLQTAPMRCHSRQWSATHDVGRI